MKLLNTAIALVIALSGLHSFSAAADNLQETTDIQYLSGTGYGDTRTWDFYCTGGMNSGKWSTIEVPSQWEQQGFGGYTYGRFYLDKNAVPSDEKGLYKYTFTVPDDWKGKRIKIVFEGALTDTDVKINGKNVGKTHRGGFTEFSYDIDRFIRFGSPNLLEVSVIKESADKSVNAAERRADWWLFGGIYRPVYLKALPKTHIERVAVDARADGTLNTTLFTKGVRPGYSVDVELLNTDGSGSFGIQNVPVESDSAVVSTVWNNIRKWDCEHPDLYDAVYVLRDKKGKELHRHKERIGFRTVEFRRKDGIYLNGTKLLLKGVNRHCFNPESGRTLNRQLSLRDAELIKEMNMNAVRSHYAPDRHFLDICDSIGLLYLDEFPGWHGRYDSEAGLPLLIEHIARDVNHPSVILWDNGNEGGWNTSLDGIFPLLDPQKRHVLHPWADFNGIDTHHYPAYQTGPGKLANGTKVFMPTEFLHSRYDKGAGAGLEDFWENYRRNPMFAGGFIWAFVDEAVARTDRNGILDSDGSNGCDGIVGPHREKEGSFFTIRDVWAPVQFAPFNVTESFDGSMLVTNEYLFSNFDECSMKYRLYKVSAPGPKGEKTLMEEGVVSLPSIGPGETGRARFPITEKFREADILEIEMTGNDGKIALTRTWPVHFAAEYLASALGNVVPEGKAVINREGDIVTLSGSGVSVSVSTDDGMIKRVISDGKEIPFTDGPLPVGMKAIVKDAYTAIDGNDALLTVKYTGGIDSIVWRMAPDGILSMDAVMLNRPDGGRFKGKFHDDKIRNLGITFSYPEKDVKGMKWLGNGPYRVWKNRQRGANFGLWEKEYNNTVTGAEYESLVYPEFKGYHGGLYWATLDSGDYGFTVHSSTDGLYFRVFTPKEADDRKIKEDSMEPFPEGDISFLFDINAMRSFKPVSEHGPKSQPSTVRIKNGDEGLLMSLRFDFRQEK